MNPYHQNLRRITEWLAVVVGGGCLHATAELFSSDNHVIHLVGFHVWFCPIASISGQLQMALSATFHRFLGWHHIYWLKISKERIGAMLMISRDWTHQPESSHASGRCVCWFVTLWWCAARIVKSVTFSGEWMHPFEYNRAKQEHWFRLQKS